MNPNPIVTHSGGFHADEIAAIALLSRFAFSRPVVVGQAIESEKALDLINKGVIPDMPTRYSPDGLVDERTPHVIIRTRNPKLLAAATANPDVFVVDVGGVDDAERLNFDHHQASMKKAWADGTPLSAAGLVWQWLRANNHLDLPQGVCDLVERQFIMPLDAHDNGVRSFDLADVLGGYNRSSEDASEQDYQFSKALEAMGNALENSIYRASVRLEAEQTLREAWNKAQARNEDFVILRKPLPYPDGTGLLAQVSNGKASLIAIPGQGNRYSVISLRMPGTRFDSKCPMPQQWRGRTDFKAMIKGQEVGLAFAHKTGFMCVVEGGFRPARLVAAHVDALNRKPAATSRGPSP